MASFVRFLHVLRKGKPRQRFQILAGLVITCATTIWIILYIWELLLAVAAFLLGIVLIGRSLRESRSSSSSSSSSSS